MNLVRMHMTLEAETKKEIRQKYVSDSTGLDSFESSECVTYECEVKKLGYNLLKYKVKYNPDEVKNWISTRTY